MDFTISCQGNDDDAPQLAEGTRDSANGAAHGSDANVITDARPAGGPDEVTG